MKNKNDNRTTDLSESCILWRNDMEYKYAGTYSDMKRIDKLNKMTNPKTFWSEIDKITKNLVSLTAINSWNMLAEIRYKELTELSQ